MPALKKKEHVVSLSTGQGPSLLHTTVSTARMLACPYYPRGGMGQAGRRKSSQSPIPWSMTSWSSVTPK